ncbi:GNAT family N-acetyltransferase [Nonomuraea typhae]|uniref:GNAT family N-acetyltransferase n=1 Tax=Nonomuraea typhae TaxID=2603600 RepID=UPI0012F78B0C|nr:GNAT family N-acetyltransferase [Nonomuraea typhae]
MSSEYDRILQFQRDFALRKAARTLPLAGGAGLLNDRFPGSHDDNKLLIWSGADARAVLRAADEVLAGRSHRYVHVHDDRLGRAFAPAFLAAGYEHSVNLTMIFRGQPPPRPRPVAEIGLAEMVRVLRRDWRESLPDASEQVVDELARRVEHRLLGADFVGFRGVRVADGSIAARADLYRQDGIAQIESVYTAAGHRGRGHARVLLEGLLAEAAGAEVIFLDADDHDWPKQFYGRLGFVPLGRTHGFLRV